jgi:transcriptional regulator with XRE-family HTH domain
MIKTTQQLHRTQQKIAELKDAIDEINVSSEYDDSIKHVYVNGYEVLIRELEAEINEYQSLLRGELVLPEDIDILEISKYITKIRIAKGLSQKELAERVGVDKQAINRYEEHDYQTASLPRIMEVLKALNIETETTLVEASKSMKLMDCEKEAQAILDDFEALICQLGSVNNAYKFISVFVGLDLLSRQVKIGILAASIEDNIQTFIDHLKMHTKEVYIKHKLERLSCKCSVFVIDNPENIENEKKNILNLLKHNKKTSVREVACTAC